MKEQGPDSIWVAGDPYLWWRIRKQSPSSTVEWTLHFETKLMCWLVQLSDSEETHLFSTTCNFKGKDVSAAGRRVKWGHSWNSRRDFPVPLPCFILFHLHWPTRRKTDAPTKWNVHFLILWMTRPDPRCPHKWIFISLLVGTPHLTWNVKAVFTCRASIGISWSYYGSPICSKIPSLIHVCFMCIVKQLPSLQ